VPLSVVTSLPLQISFALTYISISDSPAQAVRGGYRDEPNWGEQRKNKLQAKNLTQPGCNQSKQAGGESKNIISELSFRGPLYLFWSSTREKNETHLQQRCDLFGKIWSTQH
jgi:hypothetical protein